MAGILISFDGLDSSGKATQSRLLATYASSRGVLVGAFSSPDYTTESGKELKLRLQGKLGNWQETPWQEKMKYFADNRAEHRNEVLDILSRGGIVIYDRYVPSSMAFMVEEAMRDPNNTNSREEVQTMVAEYEYATNAMPQEDVSLFFDIPPRVAAELLEGRKHDQGDEAEYTDYIAIQEGLYDEYGRMVKEFPDRMVRVACMNKNGLQRIEEVGCMVRSILADRFSEFNHIFL